MTNAERFEKDATLYAAFRPTYPDSLLALFVERILAVQPHAGDAVIDVGSGSGIFTRQLRARLPGSIPLIGIEPAEAMREQALRAAMPGVEYREGSAEALSFPAHSARAIIAATAAHWFDRPRFYASATQVLAPGGLLAIAEYVRDKNGSPAARAVIDFLKEHGEPRAYARPDYPGELRGVGRFMSVDAFVERQILSLTMAEFVGLALSSSHARHAIAKMGREGAEAEVRRIGAPLADQTGRVPFGYIFQLFIAQ